MQRGVLKRSIDFFAINLMSQLIWSTGKVMAVQNCSKEFCDDQLTPSIAGEMGVSNKALAFQFQNESIENNSKNFGLNWFVSTQLEGLC